MTCASLSAVPLYVTTLQKLRFRCLKIATTFASCFPDFQSPRVFLISPRRFVNPQRSAYLMYFSEHQSSDCKLMCRVGDDTTHQTRRSISSLTYIFIDIYPHCSTKSAMPFSVFFRVIIHIVHLLSIAFKIIATLLLYSRHGRPQTDNET